jgi:hypothetical protein
MSALIKELNSGTVGIGLNRRAVAEIERLTDALKEIAEGKGAYSQDQMEHASNTIEDMKKLATDALRYCDNCGQWMDGPIQCCSDPVRPEA